MGEYVVADGLLIFIAFVVGAFLISIPLSIMMMVWEVYIKKWIWG